MTLVEDEDAVLVVDGQRPRFAEQAVEFLQRGHHNFVVLLLQIGEQGAGVYATIDAVGLKSLIFLHRLVVEVFAVHHEKHFVHEVQLRGQSCSLETRERLSASGGVPHISSRLGAALLLGLIGRTHFPEYALCGGYLIGAHDEQAV